MDREVLLSITLALSFGATVACWIRIWRSVDHAFFKVTGVLIAAIPFVGPVFYLFTCLPPRLPQDAQVPELPKGTRVREQMTSEMFRAWRKHLDHLYGVDHPGKKNQDNPVRGPK